MRDAEESLTIVHLLRAPLGGLFRHVIDLSREQISRGHRVGVIADSTTGGARADAVLAELAPDLALLERMPMARAPAPSDVGNIFKVTRRLKSLAPDVIHGHGSKGGLYARAPGLLRHCPDCIRVYTPHGGSFHYAPGSLSASLFMATERVLARATDLFMFESSYIRDRFALFVQAPDFRKRVALNGVREEEFEPVERRDDATDFFYIGELRDIKGVEVLIDAVASLQREGRPITLNLVGDGPDRASLERQASETTAQGSVRFLGPMAAREAFARGRILVVPSRAESLPYVVIEAAAAACPMIATNVGGVPEIFGPWRDSLIEPGDRPVLARAMSAALDAPHEQLAERAGALRDFVRQNFTIGSMTDSVLDGYRDALARKRARLAYA